MHLLRAIGLRYFDPDSHPSSLSADAVSRQPFGTVPIQSSGRGGVCSGRPIIFTASIAMRV
jgi:hypothetical protein